MEDFIKMKILEELRDLEVKENLSEELKRERLPLIMWGAGEVAEEVHYYLKQNGIILSDVFVDDAYYSENLLFNGKQVLSYSMLVEKYDSVNLVLGCSNYEKIKYLEDLRIVNKVFYLFSFSYGMYEKTSIEEIKENIDEFEQIYAELGDEMSRRNYLAFLKTRLSGNNSYIFQVFEKEMTYFNNDIYRINDKEVFLDIGAYDGDTIRIFLKENDGKYQHIYALEPDEMNKKKLEDYIKESDFKNITVAGKAPWREKGELHFISNDNGQLSSLVFGNIIRGEGQKNGIVAEPLDTMFQYEDSITLIKINYLEGVKEALQGAEHILKTHQPKLAISVGLDCANIRYIFKLIKEINPAYKLYLRYNRGTIETLMCYGIV